MSNTKKVPKTTKDLFAFVCNQMTQLDNKQIDVDTAKAQASLAKQANNLLKYEIERAKMVCKYPDAEIRDIEG